MVEHCIRTASTGDMKHTFFAETCHLRGCRQIAQIPYAKGLRQDVVLLRAVVYGVTLNFVM